MPWWWPRFWRRGRGRGFCWWFWWFWYNQTRSWGPWPPPYVPSYTPQQKDKTAGKPSSLREETSVIETAKRVLSNARIVGPTPWAPWIQIVYEGKTIGFLWENVPLSDIEIGKPTLTGAGWNIPLLYGGRVVGYINM